MTRVRGFVPDEGDIILLNFSPQAGHEQANRRPALVLSKAGYNAATGLLVCCPMTSKEKGYPFEVIVGPDSVVLADQVKSLDWRVRAATLKGKMTGEIIAEVRGKLRALLGI
jgi:mRNA interferase MazF